jgi:anthranilate/para-aminobenzoate synthase component I
VVLSQQLRLPLQVDPFTLYRQLRSINPSPYLFFLRDRLREKRPAWPEGLELPRFVGGAVGMVGYDWVRSVERIPDENADVIGLPDLWFVIPETVVVYDNVRHTALLVRMVEVDEGDDPGACYREACAQLESLVRRLREPLPAEPTRPPVRAPMEVESNVSREEFHQAVKRAKSSRWCCRSSSGCRFRWIRSPCIGSCARSTPARTSSSCAARAPC